MAAAIRPRFRFGLRTMFAVVTVLCIWLGWNAYVVQRRIQLRRNVERESGKVWTLSEYEANPIFAHDIGMMARPTVSAWRRLLGDEGIVQINVGKLFGDGEKFRELESWFPEAEVVPPPSDEVFVPAD